MRTEEYEKLKREAFEDRAMMAASKAREYASDHDRLDNFKRLGVDAGIDPIAVLAIYWGKHVDSIKSFCRSISQGKTLAEIESGFSEPIEGRIDDCQEYLDLLRALIKERRM